MAKTTFNESARGGMSHAKQLAGGCRKLAIEMSETAFPEHVDRARIVAELRNAADDFDQAGGHLLEALRVMDKPADGAA